VGLKMRLTSEQVRTIRQVVAVTAGPEATVRLFGSRLDDHQRGGDIDLLVTFPSPIENAARLGAQLEARLEVALGGRKVDVVLAAPNLARQAIHRVAEHSGVLL